MIGVNVPIAYHTFVGRKAFGFGDLNQHGSDSFRSHTRTKTETQRWTDGVATGANFSMPIMD
ncbi:hypothetical protein [Corynebacterium xerosis]|uniref:hypothetical protein n=1 Tax=Corynebacterium xerosis TaxID=1725 RepID=UPI0039C25737